MFDVPLKKTLTHYIKEIFVAIVMWEKILVLRWDECRKKKREPVVAVFLKRFTRFAN